MTAGSAVYMSGSMGFLPEVPANGPVQFWLAKLELLLKKELAELLDKLARLDDEFDEDLFDELLEDELLFDELLDEEILLKTLLAEELERITIIEDDDSELLLDELLLEFIVSLLELIASLLDPVESELLLATLAAIDEDKALLEVLDSSVPWAPHAVKAKISDETSVVFRGI
jgi:hypothetical protein